MKPCRFDFIAKTLFTQKEQERYIMEGKNQTAFYRMWTKRESVGKYLGVGFHLQNRKMIRPIGKQNTCFIKRTI